jgi:hypothetical protein
MYIQKRPILGNLLYYKKINEWMLGSYLHFREPKKMLSSSLHFREPKRMLGSSLHLRKNNENVMLQLRLQPFSEYEKSINKKIALTLSAGRHGEIPNLNLEHHKKTETEFRLPHLSGVRTTAAQSIDCKQNVFTLR